MLLARVAFAILALTAAGCAGRVYTFSSTPSSIEVGANALTPDQDLADVAQRHCQQTRRDAVEVRRTTGLVMPDTLGGRAVLYHCQARG